VPQRKPTARKAAENPPPLDVSARELLESVPDAVVGVDAGGSIVLVNIQAERMFGYEPSEMLGQRIELLLPDRLEEAHARHRAGYHANPGTRPMGLGLDLLARRKDGTEFPVEISLSPLETLKGIQVISAIRDVTYRREIETERARLLEVAERARIAAEEALRAHAEAECLKNDLINMVVHDLKNPVNGIAMLVQLLLRKGNLSATQETSIVRIGRTSRELLRLIGNVLEIAKIESGEMPVASELVVLAEVVDEVTAEYGPIATELERRITVAMSTDLPPVVADRGLLKRVLVNLIANALRHSGSKEICVGAAPDPVGDRITVSVVDQGDGIPAADQAGIFEKFRTRPGDPTADTGLGLPFCKLAVERMQGRIVLRSAPGAGTMFAVTLPCVTS
jgi:PAS domain S-box-containing protein